MQLEDPGEHQLLAVVLHEPLPARRAAPAEGRLAAGVARGGEALRGAGAQPEADHLALMLGDRAEDPAHQRARRVLRVVDERGVLGGGHGVERRAEALEVGEQLLLQHHVARQTVEAVHGHRVGPAGEDVAERLGQAVALQGVPRAGAAGVDAHGDDAVLPCPRPRVQGVVLHVQPVAVGDLAVGGHPLVEDDSHLHSITHPGVSVQGLRLRGATPRHRGERGTMGPVPSAPPVSVARIPQSCPVCGSRELELTYCGCGQNEWHVFTCQATGCGAEVEVGEPDAEELLRRLVMDYGDDLRQLCDHPEDCECSAAAVLRYAEEGE